MATRLRLILDGRKIELSETSASAAELRQTLAEAREANGWVDLDGDNATQFSVNLANVVSYEVEEHDNSFIPFG